MSACLVTGLGCGGTSAVAGVVHKLGFPMYLEGHSADHPDSGAGLYEDRCLYGVLQRMTPEAMEHVKEVFRTHRRERYGFKNTLLGKALPWVIPLVPDTPHVVAVHRTLVSSIEGRMAGRCCVPFGKTYTREEAERWAVQAKIEYLKGVQAVESWGVTTHHVSFEHLLSSPAAEIGRLAEWLGVEVTSEALEHIQPKLTHY